MKKLAILLIVVIAGAADATAQALRVRLADNSRFNLSVNGRYFNKRGTSVTVGDLPEGRNNLKIYAVSYDRWGRAYDRTIYQGVVKTRFGIITHFVYDPLTGRVTIKDMPLSTGSGYVQDRSATDNNQYRAGNDDGSNRNYDESYKNLESAGGSDGSAAAGKPLASPIPAGSFDDGDVEKLKTKVAAKGTDTEKLKLVKETLKKQTVTTMQVTTMIDWFLFESTKVELAKWAYSITTDKDFYMDIANKFSYTSSKEELGDFVASRK